MILQLKTITGDIVNVNTETLNAMINDTSPTTGRTYSTMLDLGREGHTVHVSPSIRCICERIYELGYKDGSLTRNPETDESELKGYIKSNNGDYVNINHITAFWKGDADRTEVKTSGCEEIYYFYMPIEEFKKMLAKKQEEMK